MKFAHFVLHRTYKEYLDSTTPDERVLYYEHYALANLKEGYWNTMPDQRPKFGLPEVDLATKQMTLDAMIEESLQKQRELNAQQAAQNGTATNQLS